MHFQEIQTKSLWSSVCAQVQYAQLNTSRQTTQLTFICVRSITCTSTSNITLLKTCTYLFIFTVFYGIVLVIIGMAHVLDLIFISEILSSTWQCYYQVDSLQNKKKRKRYQVPGTCGLLLVVVGFDIEKNFTSNLHTSTLQHKTKLNTFEFFSTQSHAVRIARLDAEKAADTKDKLEMISPGKNFKSELPVRTN